MYAGCLLCVGTVSGDANMSSSMQQFFWWFAVGISVVSVVPVYFVKTSYKRLELEALEKQRHTHTHIQTHNQNQGHQSDPSQDSGTGTRTDGTDARNAHSTKNRKSQNFE